MNKNFEFLTRKEAAKYLGLRKSTLEAWACRGNGPKYVKMGKAVRYRLEDLNDFVERSVRTSTSEA